MLLLVLPEEVLLVVLGSAILPSDPRLSLPEPQSLLTCRTIHRIGLPILYQSILLRSNLQALKVERTILSRPELVHHIRHLYSSAPTFWLTVFRAISDAKGSLQTLDIVIHHFLFIGEDVWPSLPTVPVRRLVVRQGPGLLQGRAAVAARAMARAIEGWTSLVRAFVARNEPLTLQKKKKTGRSRRRTPRAVLLFSSARSVPSRIGTVPLAFVAHPAHCPASVLESVLTHFQREPQSGSHRAHKASGTPEPGRPVADRHRRVDPRTARTARRSPMASRSAETS